MARETLYRQCTIEKRQGTSTLTRTFWGPADVAQAGRRVKVEEDDGTWSDGWQVVAAYPGELPEKLVLHRSHDHTRQRKASDI